MLKPSVYCGPWSGGVTLQSPAHTEICNVMTGFIVRDGRQDFNHVSKGLILKLPGLWKDSFLNTSPSVSCPRMQLATNCYSDASLTLWVGPQMGTFSRPNNPPNMHAEKTGSLPLICHGFICKCKP